MTFFEILMSLSVSLIQSPNNSSKSAINLVDKGLYATMNRWRIAPCHFLRSELGYLAFLEEAVETEVGQQADVSFFYLLHTLYVFICYAKIMPASAMKACFLIAECRTIFCKDTLNICNFQIFRAVIVLSDSPDRWKI